jgi:hypothetical protein
MSSVKNWAIVGAAERAAQRVLLLLGKRSFAPSKIVLSSSQWEQFETAIYLLITRLQAWNEPLSRVTLSCFVIKYLGIYTCSIK